MDLNEIKTFVKVVQTGSFTQAARQLGMPNSTVSAKVSALEKRLGVTLLQRTTRKLRLTEAGETYFRESSQGLEQILKAENDASSSQAEPHGLLRITGPMDMGNNCLTELVSGFRKKYPQLSLEFLFTDRRVDLVAEGIDVAIRAGELRDSGLIARKIGLTYWIAVASPAYLKRAGTPSTPDELDQHVCLQFTPFGADAWELTDGKRTVNVPLTRRLVANELSFVKQLALAADGIAMLPAYMASAEIKTGKLVRVLPDWRSRMVPLHLVYPGQKFVPPKVRAFVDWALEGLRGEFGE